MGEKSIIGKSIPLIESTDKITGKATFATDVKLPGMLYGKIFRSVQPHAFIKRLDTSKASKLAGVKAVITAAEVPDGTSSVFATDKVYYIGQPMAAVAAIDLDLASEALELIEVEYEPLEALFDLTEAIKPAASTIHPDRQPPPTPKSFNNICSYSHLELGDVEEGFGESDFIFEDVFRVPMAHQGYIEPHCAVASFSLDGKLVVYSGAQGQFGIRATLSRILRIPINQWC